MTLRLRCEADTLPYVQELYQQEVDDLAIKRRVCRIGVVNDSRAVVPDVRVMLESLTSGRPLRAATPEPPVVLEHALKVMGIDNKTGRVDVLPGDLPTAFFDVAVQDVDTGTGTGGAWWSPCYASGHRLDLPLLTRYVLGLRVEGGGTSLRAGFIIEAVASATPGQRRITMRAKD